MPLGLSCKPRALYKNKQPTEFIIYYFPLIVLSGWKSDYGGYTTYLTSGEDEEVFCNIVRKKKKMFLLITKLMARM